jgi:hypothetical protein
MWWCRDRYGVYGGGAGAEYYSEDGGSVWFGEGDGWVQVSEEALEFVSATSARKLRAKALSRSTYALTHSLAKSHVSQAPAGTAGAGAGPVKEELLQSADGKGMQPSWENDRQVLLGGAAAAGGAGAGCSSSDEAVYQTLYGSEEAIARVRAEEARLNAALDRALKAHGGMPPPLWPELPLRLS